MRHGGRGASGITICVVRGVDDSDAGPYSWSCPASALRADSSPGNRWHPGTALLREVLPARPQRLPDDRFHQALHIRGTFDQSNSLGDYPFDTQTLRMSFEERSFGADRILMVPGNPPITADPVIHLAGFRIGKPVLILSRHVYAPRLPGVATADVTQV